MNKWTKFLALTAAAGVLAACGNGAQQDTAQDPATEETTADTTEETTATDTATEDTAEDTAAESSEETAESAESDESSEEADATTGATEVVIAEDGSNLPEDFNDAWIVIFESDVEYDQPLTLEGGIEDNYGGESRKLALYEATEDQGIGETYTFTLPELVIEADDAWIRGGTVAADVVVEGENLEVSDGGQIDGNVDFASQEAYETAEIEEGAITGEVTVNGEPVE